MASAGQIRRELKKAYKRLKTWRAVGAAFGISGGMAYRMVNEGYEPKDPHIRVKLGLPAMVPAPVCPACGEVHVSKRCTKKTTETRRARSRLFDLPVGLLRRMLDEREEF